MSTAEWVEELLNSAALTFSDAKITILKEVQELIMNKDPMLLDSFLDAIITFQADKSIKVRMFMVNFIEEACKLDNNLLMRLLVNLHMLLEDENVHVVKKSILTMIQLYKVALKWVARSHDPSEQQESCWDLVTEMTMVILLMLESDNDGICTHAVKFVENLIITLSPCTSDSDVPKIREGDISLEQIPQDHPYLKSSDLLYIGKYALKDMLKFMTHPAISSINLIASLGSLASIARQQPIFMAEVIQAYETLHANLPPTLSKTQERSVKKTLKLHLLSLLRLPSSYDYQAQISTLLLDLGSSQEEIACYMPPPRNSSHKRTRDGGDGGQKIVAASSNSDKEEGEEKVETVKDIFIDEEKEAMPCKKRKVRKILEQPQSSSTQFPVLEEPMDKAPEQTET